MNNLRSIVLIAMLWCALGSGALCQSSKDTTARAQQALYVELSSFLFWGNISLNYEYLLSNHFSLRAGLGMGYLLDEHTRQSGGALTMVNYFTGGEHKFELGLGLSFNTPRDNNINPTPAVTIGYRYQPASPGTIFRLGLTYDYRYGGPVQVSWGKTF